LSPSAGRAPGWLLVLHRYLGMGVGLLMLMWCLSGAVMVFVQYPSLDEAMRVRGLEPIAWTGWKAPAALAPRQPVEAASVEGLAGKPVLHLRTGGRQMVVDLASGEPIRRIDPVTASAVAQAFAQRLGGRAGPATAIVRDQWTVSGEFNADRPLYRFDLGDRARTRLYISSATGQAVQRATRTQRLWSWLGAVPHWLYFAELRRNVALWSQVVIWTSILGSFLTLTGLYAGWAAFRPYQDRRWSRFGGVWLWHHLSGLLFGMLTLAWVVSGLVSMNPWGFLEGSADDATTRLQGPPPTWGQLWPALQRAAAAPPRGTLSLSLAPLDGQLYLVAASGEGRRRLDDSGAPAPLAAGDLTAAAARLADGPVASQGMIARPDAYYFSHHEAAPLPVYRVATAGPSYYLDPATGALLKRVDQDGRGYRWLHAALHRWDFIPGLQRGPIWSVLVLLLLAAASAGVATGAWMSVRAVAFDLGRGVRALRRRAAG
jgi:hypothetical protein